jgi:hypothetical protein
MRRLLLAVFCFSLGAAITLITLACWPNIYLEIADRFRWRQGLPSVGQVKLEETLIQIQLRGDALLHARSTLLFGDSHTHSLPSSALGGRVTNYSIAGEPAYRLAERIKRYPSLQIVKRVMLSTGTNDLVAGVPPVTAADFVSSAMQHVPSSTQILLIEVPPSRGNQALHEASQKFNAELSRRCAARPRCQIIALSDLADPEGWLQPQYASSDGVHLSPAGYRIFSYVLTKALHDSEQ